MTVEQLELIELYTAGRERLLEIIDAQLREIRDLPETLDCPEEEQ